MSLLTAVHEYTSCRTNKRSDEVENVNVVVVSRSSVKCSEDEDETVVMNRLKERQRNRRRRRKSSLSSSEDKNEKDDEVQTIPLVLSVDTNNIAALRLYEKFGFEYLEKNDVFCMMKFEKEV